MLEKQKYLRGFKRFFLETMSGRCEHTSLYNRPQRVFCLTLCLQAVQGLACLEALFTSFPTRDYAQRGLVKTGIAWDFISPSFNPFLQSILITECETRKNRETSIFRFHDFSPRLFFNADEEKQEEVNDGKKDYEKSIKTEFCIQKETRRRRVFLFILTNEMCKSRLHVLQFLMTMTLCRRIRSFSSFRIKIRHRIKPDERDKIKTAITGMGFGILNPVSDKWGNARFFQLENHCLAKFSKILLCRWKHMDAEFASNFLAGKHESEVESENCANQILLSNCIKVRKAIFCSRQLADEKFADERLAFSDVRKYLFIELFMPRLWQRVNDSTELSNVLVTLSPRNP